MAADAATMLGNLGVDKFCSVCFERCESALLVNAHQPTIGCYIGREDGSKPPFDTRLGHKYCPEPP